MEGINVNQLTNQAVKTKCGRQRHCDPWETRPTHSQIDHSDRGNDHCNPLQAPKLLAQKDHPKRNRKEWINKVTKAGLKHLLRGHRVNKNQPVERDKNRPGRKELEIAPSS